MPNAYYLLIGRTPELSLQEITALTGQNPQTILADKIVAVDLEDDETAINFFNQLGGSLKLLKPEGTFHDLDEPQLLQHIIAYFAQSQRPSFAIAEFGRDLKPRIGLGEIKGELKKQNISSRFVDGPRDGLSASVLIHQQKIVELGVIEKGTEIIFTHTLATQNIDDWTVRDREKPYADRKKGMLPPKVARAMVNLALGALKDIPKSAKSDRITIYDPFCGSGTVLLEAAVRGCDVAGSDLDMKAVTGTINNLHWFQEEYGQANLSSTIFQADVAHIKVDQLQTKVNAIVTEPFLGKPTPKPAEMANIFKGLEKMYLGAFKQWTHILAAESVIVIVFPHAVLPTLNKNGREQVFSLEGMIDKLAALGYTPLFESVLYYRPQAVTQRQIWTFKYTQK